MKRKGFTLLEIMIVISIIGTLLAFFVPPLVSRIQQNARITATKRNLMELRKAIVGNPEIIGGGQYLDLGFKGDVGRLPRHLIELLTNRPDTVRGFEYPGRESIPAWDPFTKKGWHGPYVRDDGKLGFLEDAWGNPILYHISPSGETIGLKSAGPDGEWYPPPSGSAENDDIIVLF
ncbi:MAG: prepilin-type N-terminal cleavage/methylation domain-containing protein [candidate division WOR-3 bacterium]